MNDNKESIPVHIQPTKKEIGMGRLVFGVMVLVFIVLPIWVCGQIF